MKNLVISLDNVSNNNIQTIVQGIKYFALKNKTISIFVVGKQKDILTLESQKNLNLVFSHLEGEEEKKDLYKFTLDLALDTLKDKNGDAFISFINKKELYSLTSKIKDISFPFYLNRFLTGITNRYSYLADAGLNDYITIEEYKTMLKESREFLSNTFQLKNPTFSLASPTENRNNLSDVDKELLSTLSVEDNFNGLSSPFNMIRGKSDLYLASGIESEFLIQGIKAMALSYKEKYDKYIKDDFFAKVSTFFARRMNKFVLSNTKSNLNRLGSFLLGKEKLIIKGDTDATATDILNMLLDIKKYLDYLTLRDFNNK